MNIKQILKKNSWKGEEIGKILIHTLVDNFLSNLEPKHKPAITMEDINTMRDSIKSPNERRIYNEYITLYNTLLDLFNMNETQAQQIHHGFFRLTTYIDGALAANSIHKATIREIPIIMTEQQYSSHISRKETELRAIGESYFALIYDAVGYYSKSFDDKPKGLPTKIKKAITVLKKKPVTNKRVLAIYNEVMGIGFHELPDGRRQDKMSEKEWENLLNEEYNNGHIIINQYEEPLSQKFADNKEAIKNFSVEKMTIKILGEYKGKPEEKIKEELYRSLNLIPLKWRISTEPPRNLTLFDILDNIDELYGFADDDTKSMAEFFIDYQELHEAIRDELCNIKPLKEKISKLKPKQYYSEKFATWGLLADWGVLDFPAKIQPNGLELVDGLGVRGFNGIAVLNKQSNEWNMNIDEHGNYIDSYTKIKHHLFDLENLAEQEENIIFARDLFLGACWNCTAGLALMSILSEIYDVVEDVKVLMSKTYGLVDDRVEAINSLAAHLYHYMKEDTGKQNLVQKLFPPIDASELLPTKGAIETMKKRLTDNRGDLKYLYPATLRAEIIKASIGERKNVNAD
jgi:hypothetical protein